MADVSKKMLQYNHTSNKIIKDRNLPENWINDCDQWEVPLCLANEDGP